MFFLRNIANILKFFFNFSQSFSSQFKTTQKTHFKTPVSLQLGSQFSLHTVGLLIPADPQSRWKTKKGEGRHRRGFVNHLRDEKVFFLLAWHIYPLGQQAGRQDVRCDKREKSAEIVAWTAGDYFGFRVFFLCCSPSGVNDFFWLRCCGCF